MKLCAWTEDGQEHTFGHTVFRDHFNVTAFCFVCPDTKRAIKSAEFNFIDEDNVQIACWACNGLHLFNVRIYPRR